MFCVECGKEIPDGVKFCSDCGASQIVKVEEKPIVMVTSLKKDEH
ncbi:MAG TPA: zinc ribbon domain-containing protein [Candidatus Poseidoniia archaeon]|nr:zinc ribbon domain-containing protein [Candidatus Poseidoniia archaeon]